MARHEFDSRMGYQLFKQIVPGRVRTHPLRATSFKRGFAAARLAGATRRADAPVIAANTCNFNGRIP